MDNGKIICDNITLTTTCAVTSQKPNHNLSSHQSRKQTHNLRSNQPQIFISWSMQFIPIFAPHIPFPLRTNQRKLNMLLKPITSDNHFYLTPVSPCQQLSIRAHLKLSLCFIINLTPLPVFESLPNANDGS